MKRTGAKNYRYTDVHWQCVPTRARFLCFWGDTPGRQFRENSHERARRSPGIDVQESDPPLPFAWQSAKADLGTRTSPRRSAKADLATGTSPRQSAKAPGGSLPPGHTGPGRAAAFRRGTRGRAGRREKGFFYTRKAGLPVLRVSQTTQKLRRLLSCFFARKER